MPILIMGVMALVVFVVIGFMLFGATWAESRERERRKAAAVSVPQEVPAEHLQAKGRAAHA